MNIAPSPTNTAYTKTRDEGRASAAASLFAALADAAAAHAPAATEAEFRLPTGHRLLAEYGPAAGLAPCRRPGSNQ